MGGGLKEALPLLGASISVPVKWARWTSGIPKALGDSITVRLKAKCHAHVS